MRLLHLQARTQRGFTLIEVLIVVAILGIIATLIMPNMIDSIRKAKQKRTMTDIHYIGNAWMSWLTDEVSASGAGQQQLPELDWSAFEAMSLEDVQTLLVPHYANVVPAEDAWGGGFDFAHTESPHTVLPIAIRSPGIDGEFSGTTYVRGAFLPTEYEEDIVWAGGYFARWPSGAAVIADD